jgi:hypothetical protein
MKTLTSTLVIVWLVILTLTSCYNTGTDQKLLKLVGSMIGDNLKNYVVSGKETYYVVGMKLAELSRGDEKLPMYFPVYVTEQVMLAMMDKSRKEYIMLKEFQKMEMDILVANAKRDAWFQSLLKKGDKKDEVRPEKLQEQK